MNSGKVLLGVLAGLAAGAALGILFAPAKGSDTRKKIAHKGKGYADSLKTQFNDLLSTVSENFEKDKPNAVNFDEQGKSASKGTERSVSI
jgi:gas vesicle protein